MNDSDKNDDKKDIYDLILQSKTILYSNIEFSTDNYSLSSLKVPLKLNIKKGAFMKELYTDYRNIVCL